MANRSETFSELEKTMNFFLERFNKNIGTRQQSMWSTIFKTIKRLETNDQGDILTTNKNIKILRTLRGDISKTIITPQYKKDLEGFLRSFDELKGINDTYYQAVGAGTLNANKFVFKEIVNNSIEATSNSLLEAGINNEIIGPVQEILNQNVTTGAKFTDMTEILRMEILGNNERLGRLDRYTKQITTDALNQFNANYNQAVAQDLEFQFYYYNGGLKETSRQYCKDLVNGGRYYHKEEIQESSSGEWAGKIPGTNDSNIFVYRGGYNCGHQWLAVADRVVPTSVKERARAKGYYE